MDCDKVPDDIQQNDMSNFHLLFINFNILISNFNVMMLTEENYHRDDYKLARIPQQIYCHTSPMCQTENKKDEMSETISIVSP